MTTRRTVVRWLMSAGCGLFWSGGAVRAQDTLQLDAKSTAPRPTVPVRSVVIRAASDSGVLMDVSSVRQLRDGAVLVNDTRKRQLVLFDSTLKRARVISDTSSNSPNTYGLQVTGGSLIPYVGDSTLFVDFASQAFLVIDEHGKFSRVMAPVRANDLFYIGSGAFGATAFDPQGRMLYRSYRRRPPQAFAGFGTGNSRQTVVELDSAPIMRMDFDKRTVDTLGFIKIPPQKYTMISTVNSIRQVLMLNPLPQTDEWTVLPDGTVAIVRGQDYHIDWLAPDGKITSSPRMPFDWRRITLEDKRAMIDSVKKAEAERVAKLPPPPPTPPGQPAFPPLTFDAVDPTDLPDYFPAVRQGQVRSDREGQVWILPATSKDAKEGGLLYDVVNREGRIVERVQLPKSRTLIGFGQGGVVYMNHVMSPTRASVERAVIER